MTARWPRTILATVAVLTITAGLVAAALRAGGVLA